jgi:hypothetical protein
MNMPMAMAIIPQPRCEGNGKRAKAAREGLAIFSKSGSQAIWADRSSAVVIVRRTNYIVDERERASSFGMIVTIHRGAPPDRSSLTD